MKSLFFLSLILTISNLAFCKKAKSVKFRIDTSVVSQAESRFAPSSFPYLNSEVLIYKNRVEGDFYKNDTLSKVSEEMNLMLDFRSYYYVQNDTLVLEGLYGIEFSFGFTMKIYKSKMVSIHYLNSSDITPVYAYTASDTLQNRLEVASSVSEIIFSDYPKEEGRIIYGYLDLQSEEFYSLDDQYGVSDVRNKEKVRLKMYFKATYVEITNNE